MKNHLINNNSNNLILFFAGWGCDEFCFEHLKSKEDILIVFDYNDLDFEFNFGKYKKIDLLAYSAGIFIASVLDFDLKFDKKIAISGNPYLFDNRFGIPKDVQDVMYNLTEENAESFIKNYLVNTNEEYEKFQPSKRTLESCREEFHSLEKMYEQYRSTIKDIFDIVIAGENDPVFILSIQKELFKKRLKIVQNARHNIFFKFESYEEIFEI